MGPTKRTRRSSSEAKPELPGKGAHLGISMGMERAQNCALFLIHPLPFVRCCDKQSFT